MELLEDPDEIDEVGQLITWWNRFGHAFDDLVSANTLNQADLSAVYRDRAFTIQKQRISADSSETSGLQGR